jgi:hypothetical protein
MAGAHHTTPHHHTSRAEGVKIILHAAAKSTLVVIFLSILLSLCHLEARFHEIAENWFILPRTADITTWSAFVSECTHKIHQK